MASVLKVENTWNPKPTEKNTCKSCGVPAQPNGRSLSSCAKCVMPYCSRACQERDWPEHKEVCKTRQANMAEFTAEFRERVKSPDLHLPMALPVDRKVASAWRLIPKPGKDITFKRMSHLSGFTRNSDRWVDLPVTNVLGFPLRLMAAPGSHPTTLKNPEAMRLGTIPFPENPNYGASQFSGEAEGAVMIMRADGQDMHYYQLRAMVFHVMQRLNELPGVKARESKGKVAKREELAGRLLTPVAFRKFWDKLKMSDTEKSADDGEIWESVECSIKLD
ncbi:Zinc finger MYND domain-containing protein 10 [Elasticomyces elasticus]|nr:Zinc finger MYND domain-containing protein 10 [Elasticomyces elasticus]